ncbi:MAG: hypothetical protein JO325_19070, partial [Solirubrobacterales bacterium]|nr:hypothetical protein [Solirubrobacterales bacterium]
PRRTRLFPSGAKGSRLKIEGQVLAVDGAVVVGATIHVWLADPTGAYDNQDANGDPLSIPAFKQLFRGRLTTGRTGRYAFTCLRPGNYFDGGWKLWRPAHIHVKLSAEGYQPLTTQLYFHGDEFLDSDVARAVKDELILPLEPAGNNGSSHLTLRYDFQLAPACA